MCLDCFHWFHGRAADFTRAQTTNHKHVSVIYLPERQKLSVKWCYCCCW